MRSETNQGYEVQVRTGSVTLESYLFFPRQVGDLLLEPGDEIILAVRQNRQAYPTRSSIGDSAFFEKVKNHFYSTQVLDRLTGRPETDSWRMLKDAINKAR